jgi:hypothetical protein
MTALYRGLDRAALDAQYTLRQAVPAHPAYFARWAAMSRAVRDGMRCSLDIAYGDGKLRRRLASNDVAWYDAEPKLAARDIRHPLANWRGTVEQRRPPGRGELEERDDDRSQDTPGR